MSALSTAEFERLSLIAAGVDPSQIPSILDTATWRRLLIAGLLKNAANQAISGQVDNYSQLPVTVGAPAIGATYLVKYSTGIFYINYKSAGIYVKVADTGSLTDWVYAPLSAVGTLPDVTLTNPQVGDTITWNGTNWINSDSISELINPTEPTLFDLDRFGGPAQVVSTGSQITVFSTGDLIQSQLNSGGAAITRSHLNFYPTDSIYQGGPRWDWSKRIVFTFPVNLNSGSANNSFVRVGIGEVALTWITNPTPGWNIAGGDRKRMFGRGFAADFDSVSRRARLTWQGDSGLFSYVETANNVVGSDSIDLFTMIHTSGKLQLYKTMSRQLLLELQTGSPFVTNSGDTNGYQVRVATYTPTATSVMGYPSNPKIRISNLNY